MAWLALFTAQAMAQTPNTLEVWMDKEVKVTADGETVTYLTVSEKDPNVNYIAYNMTFTLPKGFKIHQVKSGREYVNDISLSERATSTHQIDCNMPTEGMLKVICTSTQNYELYPDDADGNIIYPIFTIGLVADPSVINGIYDVEMYDVTFVRYLEDGITLAGVDLDHTEYSRFTVTGGTDFPGVDYTLPAEGCGTMILPFNAAIPEGMSVYACTGISSSSLNLEAVSDIQANTPYIVTGPEGTYHFTGEYQALKASYSTPYMTGVFEQMKVPEGNFVMQNHKDTYGIGFYRVGTVETIINPYRCYVNNLSNEINVFGFNLGQTDGVSSTKADKDEPVNVYRIDGQAIRTQVKRSQALNGLAPGIYIINNQKYIVK